MNRTDFSSWSKTVALLAIISLLWNVVSFYRIPPQPVIKVGILHSRTGTTSLSELPVANATLMAIQEINNTGGLLGRPLEPVVADGKSDILVFAREAKKLLTEDKVDVVFGCWTSASRKTVKPIFEKYDRLLFYPVQYEGLEQSPDIIYTGAVPNQQALPATIWCMNTFGKRIFMVGSDYVFPRAVNGIIKEIISYLGADIVGEEYIMLGAEKADQTVKKIVAAKPHFILNTINGSSNIPFFQELKNATKEHPIPIMSLSVDDSLVHAIGIENVAGSYTSWSYYESIAGTNNSTFVHRIKNAYGKNQVVTDPMEAAYIGVHLWAEAVRRGGSTKKDMVLKSLQETGYGAPEGFVHVDVANHHLIKAARIAKFTAAGTSDVLWATRFPVEPEPYPSNLFIARQLGPIRSASDWDKYLYYLYLGWGEQWEAP